MAEWTKKDTTTCCLQKTYFSLKHTCRLNVEMEKGISRNNNENKKKQEQLYSYETKQALKMVKRNKEGH